MEKTFITSPIGNLKIVANGDEIIEISFCDNCEQIEILNNKRSEILTRSRMKFRLIFAAKFQSSA